MAERTRKVSRSEYMGELGRLSGKWRRKRRLEREWRSLRGRLGGLARSRSLLVRRLPYVDIIERVRIGERITAIDRESERLRTQMRHIRDTELPMLNEEIDAERRELSEKILPPPLREELIGDESCSGYDIYFDLDEKIYVVRDPDTRELIRREYKIAVALTASIRTGVGHDVPITLEITAVTYISEMDSADIITLERTLETETMNWLREQGWGALLRAFEKIGVEFNGETHVDAVGLYPFRVPDFPRVHFYVERRSRYIKKRYYEGEVSIE